MNKEDEDKAYEELLKDNGYKSLNEKLWDMSFRRAQEQYEDKMFSPFD